MAAYFLKHHASLKHLWNGLLNMLKIFNCPTEITILCELCIKIYGNIMIDSDIQFE